ncbi:hypothetical protein ACGF1Z_09560 [Streptomyces sp. NPDC048018]|uniref:hypothetical protein n=1 Tax=Streptomyces sp. NPDC048018 TaxID=3365499 RepID=UPI0037157F79
MRTRISRGLAAALAVSALSLTAACGGGEKDDAAKSGADKSAAGATTSAAPTSAAPAAPLTDARMKAALLELKDLPSGWKATKHPDTPSAYTTDKPACKAFADMMGSGDIPGATKGPSADFALGNNDSEITERVAGFTGTGAADYLEQLSTSLDTCGAMTVEADGQKMKLSAKKRTAPQGTEEAIAFTLGLEVAPGMTIEPDFVFARQGNGVVRFMLLANAAGKKDFDQLAKKATDKFAKAAQG